MRFLVLLMLLACDATRGYYSRGGYESHNLIEREEPTSNDEGILVECPVCDETDHWMPSGEVCSVVTGNKSYKRCEHGTYRNSVCGNRLDCFRGAGEKCTEKREFDLFGQRCAPGFYCNKHLGVCQGWDYVVDSRVQYILNPSVNSIGGRHKGGFRENSYIRGA